MVPYISQPHFLDYLLNLYPLTWDVTSIRISSRTHVDICYVKVRPPFNMHNRGTFEGPGKPEKEEEKEGDTEGKRRERRESRGSNSGYHCVEWLATLFRQSS